MGKVKDGEAPAKLLAAFLSKAEESGLGCILLETAILLSMHNRTDVAKILRDAAQFYKVDVDAVSAQVKQEFAAKVKSKNATKGTQKVSPKQQEKGANRRAAA